MLNVVIQSVVKLYVIVLRVITLITVFPEYNYSESHFAEV
jgi:hypothetical protein